MLFSAGQRTESHLSLVVELSLAEQERGKQKPLQLSVCRVVRRALRSFYVVYLRAAADAAV